MGSLGWFFFGEKDTILIEEIAKIHKVDKSIVEKYYKAMLEGIKNETEDKD